MTRMTAERMTEEKLSAIEALRRDNREMCHWGHVGDLLAELRAVQQERDEAREGANHWEEESEAQETEIEHLSQERDKLKQERDEARAAQDENADACEAMSREVERLHNSANMWSKAAQDNKDNMDAWASECKALRAELAKYKAVADLAREVVLKVREPDVIDAYGYDAIDALDLELVALDAKPGQEGK